MQNLAGMSPEAVHLAIQVAAITILGYAWQLARSPKNISNVWSWIGFALVSAAVYVWMTPEWMKDWRVSLLGAYLMIQAARGSASTASETGLAPATNSK